MDDDDGVEAPDCMGYDPDREAELHLGLGLEQIPWTERYCDEGGS